MANYQALMTGVEVTVLPAGTTAVSTASTPVAVPANMPYLRLGILGVGTISTGKLQWEESSDPAYSGTWSAVGSEITIVAGQTYTRPTVGVYQFLRARVTTGVTGAGGSISATILGAVAR